MGSLHPCVLPCPLLGQLRLAKNTTNKHPEGCSWISQISLLSLRAPRPTSPLPGRFCPSFNYKPFPPGWGGAP